MKDSPLGSLKFNTRSNVMGAPLPEVILPKKTKRKQGERNDKQVRKVVR